ncbi:MAG: M50 family metallopeptidase [Oscillospiraceae bacterium]|nr:M50 family metallopeptidase [Oscillospiraceae bacterium]
MFIIYIIIAIIAFGVLIAIHELGHFAAAKLLGVKVNEFAIGMGPKLLQKQGRETLYSLRAIPLGGFCAMEGEDEDVPDPRSFTAQRRWKRVVILAAGSVMNFLLGLVIVIAIFANMDHMGGTTITAFDDAFPRAGASSLTVGDRIISIDGEHLYYSDDFSTFMSLTGERADIVLERGGQKVELKDYYLVRRPMSDGTMKYGISFDRIEGTATRRLKYSGYTAVNFVRLTRISLTQLVTGRAGLRDLSGPVGIVSIINDVGQTQQPVSVKLKNIAYFVAVIAVNLAVMNMLPIPALDGGRIFFALITGFIELITRRHINPKYEGYIHAAGFALLLGLMALVMVSDVLKIING